MAAGNWLTSAGIGDLNIALAPAVIEAKLVTSVKNKEILGHPVIRAMLAADEGLGELLGALGVQIGFVDVGELVMASVAEGTEATASNFTTTSANLTPARLAVARKTSDFARSVQERLLRGALGPDAYAIILLDALAAWANTIVDLLGDLASGASYTIGTSGVALTWGALQDGIYDMKDRGVRGPMLGLLTAKGAKDLADDALSLGGAIQMAQQIQALIPNASDGAWLGTYFGACDLYLCDAARLDTSGADTLGSLWSIGGAQSKHQRVSLPTEATALVNTGLVTVEMRRPGGGITTFESVAHMAVGSREATRWAAIQYVT